MRIRLMAVTAAAVLIGAALPISAMAAPAAAPTTAARVPHAPAAAHVPAARLGSTTLDEVMSQLPEPGTTVHDVVIIPGQLVAKTVQVTAQGTTTVAKVTFHEAGGAILVAHLAWTSSCDWSLAFSGEGTSAPGSEIKPTTVTGDITQTACAHPVVNLAVNNYHFGNKTDIHAQLHVEGGGFSFSTTVENLVLSGVTFTTATLSVSTLETYISVEGNMVVENLGTFEVGAMVAKVKSGSTAPVCFPAGDPQTCVTPAPGNADAYVAYFSLKGNDFSMDSPTFTLKHFEFATGAHLPREGCATYGGGFVASATMKGVDVNLYSTGIEIHCNNLRHFHFHMDVSHTDPATNKTLTVALKVAWQGAPGSFATHSGTEVEAGKFVDTAGSQSYQQAFVGVVDVSQKRTLSKKYKDRTMHRSVTMGMVFGLAMYKKDGSSSWHTYLGMGGYFDADRISGGIGCVWGSEDNDFSCGGKIRVNPSWAGVYHYWWLV